MLLILRMKQESTQIHFLSAVSINKYWENFSLKQDDANGDNFVLKLLLNCCDSICVVSSKSIFNNTSAGKLFISSFSFMDYKDFENLVLRNIVTQP